MARIRSIKPEFPQSETVGRLSRDARLLFIQIWTIVDDAGRARAPSRMLASLLYPYDDDAPGLIDGWLDELEAAECIRRYDVDGNKYLDIPKWLTHQKIDRPSTSKLPAFPEDDTSPRDPSRASDADLDLGRDQEGSGNARARTIPDDWKSKNPNSNPAEEARFKADRKAKGIKRVDWEAEYEVWCSRIADYGEAKAPKAQGPPPPPQTWVDDCDPRWAHLSERSVTECGKPLKAIRSNKHLEPGNYVPNEWLAH